MYPSSTDAYSAIQNYNNTRKSAADLLNDANSRYGVSDLESQAKALGTTVNNLQSSIDAVDPSVTGRTGGSLVTEAQRTALVNKEKDPLVTNYNKAYTNLGLTQNNLSTARGNATTLANSLIADQNTKYQSLMDAYNSAVAAEAERRRQLEADRAFELQKKTAASAGSGAYDLSGLYNQVAGSQTAKTPTNTAATAKSAAVSQADQTRAYTAIKNLLSSKDTNLIKSTIASIQKSAGYGNPYDQYKLQILAGMANTNSGNYNLAQMILKGINPGSTGTLKGVTF